MNDRDRLDIQDAKAVLAAAARIRRGASAEELANRVIKPGTYERLLMGRKGEQR